MVRQALAENGEAYVRVTGNSMWPLLRHLRDRVVIAPLESIRAGDIVLFDRKNGRYALHRVVRKRMSGFDMAGDNQWHIERNLPYEQIVGVVIAIERKGHRLPRNSFFVKMYALTLTSLAIPRIYLWRLIKELAKMFRRAKSPDMKG